MYLISTYIPGNKSSRFETKSDPSLFVSRYGYFPRLITELFYTVLLPCFPFLLYVLTVIFLSLYPEFIVTDNLPLDILVTPFKFFPANDTDLIGVFG